ncbi:MAG: sugar ABC transporter ATP-binding protein [Synergistaceae bacterium]|nr:sugar ABC transporter ATP-binding protein [Synergistaceae bacterium]
MSASARDLFPGENRNKPETAEKILRVAAVSKTFPGVKALNNVSFDLERGEVHALVGENGAGKSTLMKILLGIYQPDEGAIEFKNREVHFENPQRALKNGISMIHQELMSFPEMTVWENIWIGREDTYSFLNIVDKSSMKKKTRELLAQFGLKLDIGRKVGSLSVAEVQMLEIIRAISYNAEVIIMDEPTSAIEEREIEPFFGTIRKLKSEGVSVIYISHKLDEIFRIADRVSILRDAAFIGTKRIGEITKDQMVSMMVGRAISNIYPVKVSPSSEDYIFEARNICKRDMFEDVNIAVKKGEILGIAGLMGSGRSELVETLFGIRRKDRGEIFMEGISVKIDSPKDAIKNGIAIVTEDRKLKGLILCRDVRENMSLVSLKNFCRLNVINRQKELSESQKMIEALSIKTPGLKTLVNSLSGGNQQKIALGKWLYRRPKLLIMDEPTRGIDVGAKFEIYKIMLRLAGEGLGVIMISSEMPEVIGMSDRVIVMHNFRIKGELARSETTQEKIMKMAIGE